MTSAIVKLPLLAFCLGLAACSTVSVTTDFDHSAPFGKYKTYALAPAQRGQTLAPASEAALREALRTELAARGITEVTHGKPDLAIVRHVFVDHVVSIQQYTDWGYTHAGTWPSRYGSYHMWSGAPTTYADVTQYHEGTMILDAVDLHTKKLVFRGTGTAVVDGTEGNAEKIREAVKQMVAALPR